MICAVTSALGHQRLVRPPLLTAVRVLAFKAGIAEERDKCSAGARPKSSPASNRDRECEQKNGAVWPCIQRSVCSALRDKRNERTGGGKGKCKTEHAAREREQ